MAALRAMANHDNGCADVAPKQAHGATTPARKRVTMKVEKNASSISVAMPPTAGTTTSRIAAANSGSGTSRAAESGFGTPSAWNDRRVSSGATALATAATTNKAARTMRGGVAEAREAHVRRPPRGWRP